MKIQVTAVDGYCKDNAAPNRKRFEDRKLNMIFAGPNAPVKAVAHLILKYGVDETELTAQLMRMRKV
jgi:hypothetical protein